VVLADDPSPVRAIRVGLFAPHDTRFRRRAGGQPFGRQSASAKLPTSLRLRNEKTRDVSRRLPFGHAGREIAGTVVPSGGVAAPDTVVLRLTVALAGRLVAAADEPRAKARVTAEFADASLWELGAIDQYMAAPDRTHC
jgi:hypothetical protein